MRATTNYLTARNTLQKSNNFTEPFIHFHSATKKASDYVEAEFDTGSCFSSDEGEIIYLMYCRHLWVPVNPLDQRNFLYTSYSSFCLDSLVLYLCVVFWTFKAYKEPYFVCVLKTSLEVLQLLELNPLKKYFSVQNHNFIDHHYVIVNLQGLI